MDKAFKIKLYNKCLINIEARLAEIRDSLNDAQKAANNETKSSAGDKHETGRAMAQLETEKLTTQLTQSLKLKETLTRINIGILNETIGLGSVVKTNNGVFFLSVGLGKITIDNVDAMVISPLSPLGKMLLNKKEKESFSFNNTNYIIEKIS